MNPIRVLHITGAMNRGGAETLIMELYRNIDRRKVQFDFMVYNYSNCAGAFDNEIQSLGGNIYTMKERFYKNPISYCIEAKRFFDKHPEYRIIHAHQYAMSGYILYMAKKSYKTVFTIAHSHIAYPKTDPLRAIADFGGKTLLKTNTDLFFGCSNDALKALTGHYEDKRKYIVMKNAINIGNFIFDNQARREWRDYIGAGADTIVIGNVARFTNQKNHEMIISVFHEIAKRVPNARLVLVGTGSKLDEIKQRVKELRLDGNVIFMGTRADVNKIINSFDVFLMPSRYEGLGIVLIEAQANGLPCVISASVIPKEADVNGDMVKRVELSEPPSKWAEECLSCGTRKKPEYAQKKVIEAGYDIKEVSIKLQDYYLEKWGE